MNALSFTLFLCLCLFICLYSCCCFLLLFSTARRQISFKQKVLHLSLSLWITLPFSGSPSLSTCVWLVNCLWNCNLSSLSVYAGHWFLFNFACGCHNICMQGCGKAAKCITLHETHGINFNYFAYSVQVDTDSVGSQAVHQCLSQSPSHCLSQSVSQFVGQ